MKLNTPIINTVQGFLDYLEIEKNLSPITQANYHRFLKKFFEWLALSKLEKMKPHEFTRVDLDRYRLHLARSLNANKQTLKKSTQNYYLIALRNLLAYYVEKDIDTLPPDKVKLAKERNAKEVKFLKIDQVERLLNSPDIKTVTGLRDRAILEVLFSTGLRVAELAALNRDQLRIKRDTNFLEISVVGKGSKVRTVYFSERSIECLRQYLDKRVDVDPALWVNFNPGKKSDEVDDRRLSIRSIENIVKKYVVMCGLPVMSSPHTMRHSYATDLLAQGVDLRLVQEFLGHSNISTTQIYTHVTNKQLRDIHQKFHSFGKKSKY